MLPTTAPIAVRAPVSVPITYADNRAFVWVRVNGQRLRFVVDTGGYDTIDTAVAKRLNLKVKPAGTIFGAGDGRANIGTATLASLQLGSRTLLNSPIGVLDMSPIAKHLGIEPLDGMIGYDFFKNNVLTFLNSQATMILGSAPLAGNTVPFSLYGSIPEIRASVDGFEGSFILDTGDRSSTTLVPAFAAAHPSLGSAIVRSHVVTGWGVGGPVLSNIVRLRSIAIGSLSARDLIGRVALAKGGSFSATDIAGTIGNGFMRRFDVSFDYRNKQLALRPNPRWTQPPCPSALSAGVIPPQECLVTVGPSDYPSRTLERGHLY